MGCCASKPKGQAPPMEEAALIKDTETQKEASDPLNIKQKEKAEEIQSEPLYLVPFQEWTPPDWSPPLEEADVLLGEVYLTVHHIPANNQVAVRLMRARHLHRRGDTADIQFAMYLCYPSGKRDEQKSTIKKSTIDPVLDERFFWEIDQGEKGEDTVLRLVANDLTQDSPYLGEIVIGIGRMGFGLLNPAWIPLRKEKFIPKIETPPETRTSTPSPSSGLEIPLLSSVASAATGAMSGAIHGATSVTKGAVNVTMGAVNLARNSLHIPDFSPRKSDDGFSVAQSFMSSASNASNSAIVKMHEYGRVYLSLYYKIPQNIVEIAVVSARLDRPANLPIPNPYVKIKLVPDLSGKVGKQKTKTQKSTNEPFFNESFSVQVEKKDSQKLQVSLWSNELGKNPFLGEALINLSTLPANETVKDWFPLESLSHGELNCHLSYDHQSDALTVTVIKARDLGNGNSQIDPYVKVYLLPDAKKSSKRKTKFKKQTLNPEFNESFRYFLPEFENAHMKFLHLSVLNHNSIGHQDPVGSFSIPLADIIEAQSIERWFPLIRDKAGAEKPTSPNTPVRKEE